MVEEKDGLLAKAQEALLTLLEDWRSEAAGWRCFRACGGDFASDPLRRMARREILQYSAGVLEYFEHTLEHPPMSLVKFLDIECSRPQKLKLAMPGPWVSPP